jgi:TrmH family RNA methyltransferase
MKLDDVKKLHQKKYRSQFGFYLVEGEHLILELVKAAEAQSSLAGITIYISDVTINRKQMSQISDTKTPQGIIARVPLPNLTSQQKPTNKGERCIYLHEVQDPGNLGTILRTLAWFGNFKLLLSANSVDPFNPKVVRASMGAIFHVPIELDVALEDLQKRFNTFDSLNMNATYLEMRRVACRVKPYLSLMQMLLQ